MATTGVASTPLSKPSTNAEDTRISETNKDTIMDSKDDWDDSQNHAALERINQLQEKISSLRLLAPHLIRTFSQISTSSDITYTGLPSPPRSPVLSPADDEEFGEGSPQAVYQRFEEIALKVSEMVKDLKEQWRSEDMKSLFERCEKRGDMAELEKGWELVIGQPRWMDT